MSDAPELDVRELVNLPHPQTVPVDSNFDGVDKALFKEIERCRKDQNLHGLFEASMTAAGYFRAALRALSHLRSQRLSQHATPCRECGHIVICKHWNGGGDAAMNPVEERKEFEKWLHQPVDCVDDDFTNEAQEMAWRSWKARAALAQSERGRVLEVIEQCAALCDGLANIIKASDDQCDAGFVGGCEQCASAIRALAAKETT